MSWLTANERPGEHARSWFAETAGALPDHPPLAGEARADVCIVGGGYAGLSAALHLAERGIPVVLLEANRLGWGASGRNGGQLGVGPRADIRKYEALVGRDEARRVWEISLAANRLVRDLIARHGIDCDLADGYLEAAWRRADLDDMQAYAAHVAGAYGHPALELLDRAGVAALIGTERYHGGFVDRLGGHLHPLRYALGLGRAAAAAGAVIHERTRVRSVAPGLVKAEGGRVRAGHVLLACNGYIDGLAPAASRRMLPINNFLIATEPLGENRARMINRDDLCVADTRFVLNYFCLTPDRRLLWGGGESSGRRFPADIASMVRRRMLEIYPDLAGLGITHAWGGTLAITGTRFPLFQDLRPGVRAIGGWSGSGIHMATMGGRIAAEAIAGETGDWDVLARMPTPAFPGGDWLRVPLLRLALFWYGLRDRL
jgi:gamma-glutamylputrescine oxidase